MSSTPMSTKHVADYHPAIAALNALNYGDWLEAEPLIEQCIEEGIYPWSNPKFLHHLHHFIVNLVTLTCNADRFMRGIIYARHIAERMPSGLDDSVLATLQTLAEGNPLPAVKPTSGIRKGKPKGRHYCHWPQDTSTLGFIHSPGSPVVWRQMHAARLEQKDDSVLLMRINKIRKQQPPDEPLD